MERGRAGGNDWLVFYLSTADGLIAETMAHAGFDVIVVDMQHGMGIKGRTGRWLRSRVLSTTDVMPMAIWEVPSRVPRPSWSMVVCTSSCSTF